MRHFLLYGHGGSHNHGAEAIVKTTVMLIREKYKDAFITLSSHFPEQDRKFHIDADEIIPPDYNIWEQEKKSAENEKEKFARLMYSEALNKIMPHTTLLSVGGDNFCYTNWHRLKVFQDEAVRKEAKSILWGASIEPSMITPDMINVLNSYSVITVREKKTFNALHKNEIKSQIRLIPDIAFTLRPETVAVPNGLEDSIGINISPLISRCEKISGIFKENILELIKFILSETEFNILLIPHVVVSMDNDYTALSEIYGMFGKHERIRLVGSDLSAAQYKFIIAKCKMLICSRTHASIAAYSSGVPCGVVGYSVKSIGIAEDLGLSKYVLPIDEITKNDCVKNMFASLMENADNISKTYLPILFDYIDKVKLYQAII